MNTVAVAAVRLIMKDIPFGIIIYMTMTTGIGTGLSRQIRIPVRIRNKRNIVVQVGFGDIAGVVNPFGPVSRHIPALNTVTERTLYCF